jgi:hypothetical protein
MAMVRLRCDGKYLPTGVIVRRGSERVRKVSSDSGHGEWSQHVKFINLPYMYKDLGFHIGNYSRAKLSGTEGIVFLLPGY